MSAPKPPSTPKALDKGSTVTKSPSSVKKVSATPDQANKSIKKKLPKTPQPGDSASKALPADSAKKEIKKKVASKPTQATEGSSAPSEQGQSPTSAFKKRTPKPPVDAPSGDSLDPTRKISDNVDQVKEKDEDTAPAQDVPKTPELETPKKAEGLKDNVKQQTRKFKSYTPQGEDAPKLIKKKIKKPEATDAALQPQSGTQGPEPQVESGEEHDEDDNPKKQTPKFKPHTPKGEAAPKSIKKITKSNVPTTASHPELEPEPELQALEPQAESDEVDEKHSEHGGGQDEKGSDDDEQGAKQSESDDEHLGIDMHSNEQDSEQSDVDASENDDDEEENEDEGEDEEQQEEYEEYELGESGGEEEAEDDDVFDTQVNDVSKSSSSAPDITSKGEDTLIKSSTASKDPSGTASGLEEKGQKTVNDTTDKSKELAGDIQSGSAPNQKKSLDSATDTAKDTREKVSKKATSAADSTKDKTGEVTDKCSNLDKSAKATPEDTMKSASDVGEKAKATAFGLSEDTKGKARDGANEKNKINGITGDIVAEPDSVFSENATKDIGDIKDKASGELGSGKKTVSDAAGQAKEKADDVGRKAASGLDGSKKAVGGLSKQGTDRIEDTTSKLPVDKIKGLVGKKVNDAGEVVDDSGEVLAKTTGDSSSLADKKVNEKGEILDGDKVVGVVSELAGLDDALVKGYTPEGGSGSVNAGGIQISVQTTKEGISLTINIPGSFQK